jgi:hypothetical protein
MKGDSLVYRFIPCRMRDLDGCEGSLLVAGIFEDDRPSQGLAGLVDWRIDGLVSRIRAVTEDPELDNPHYEGLVLGPFAAKEDEKLLFPADGRLSFFQILMVGLGRKKQYDSHRFRNTIRRILETAASLKAQQMTLQLPGWQAAGLPARRAADVFATELFNMSRAGRPVPMDVCIVESLDHQPEMDERIVEIIRSQPQRA